MTDPKQVEPEPDAHRESWSSPLRDDELLDDEVVIHPRADGEDADFEALEMEHRGMSAQR